MEDKFYIEELKAIHAKIRERIEERVSEFKRKAKSSSDIELFEELIFCLLTPQSKAKKGWSCVEKLKKSGNLLSGDRREIEREIVGVRFHKKKANFILEARKRLFKNGKFILKEKIFDKSPDELRKWLVENVKGMGYKEASHFLRNIGIGIEFAILDRHILRNLMKIGIIKSIPRSLSYKTYKEIEERMREFSKSVGIPMAHLDLLLWYKETGEIFK